MERTAHGWSIFDGKTPVLLYEYSFGPGSANALAVGIDGGLVVLSPPCGVDAGVFEDLSRHGPVRALVAPNAFHNLGLASWHARHPGAPIFAPAQAIPRLQKRTGLAGLRPLSEAAALTGRRLEMIDMPHYKTGEALVRIRSARGLAWFVTDVVMNLPVLPSHPVAKWMFKLSGSGPGLKFNNVAPLFMVRDKSELKRWLAAQADAAPPAWLIPCHGDLADLRADPDALQRMFS